MAAVVVPSWPYENADTTETQYSRLMREVGEGVIGSPGDTTLKVTADSTGMTVKVAAGPALLRGFVVQPAAETTLTIATADASARVDRVVARVNPTTNAGYLDVLKGTPGSSTPPPLTQTDALHEISLATVAVGASVVTIAASAVTDDRTFVVTGVTSGALPKGGFRYGHMHRLNDTAIVWWDGSSWVPLLKPLDTSASGDTLVLRDASGRAKVATPSAADDIATKGYVDGHNVPVAQVTGLSAELQSQIYSTTSGFTGPDVTCPAGQWTTVLAGTAPLGNIVLTTEILAAAAASTAVLVRVVGTNGTLMPERRFDVGVVASRATFVEATFNGASPDWSVQVRPASVQVTVVGPSTGCTVMKLPTP